MLGEDGARVGRAAGEWGDEQLESENATIKVKKLFVCLIWSYPRMFWR